MEHNTSQTTPQSSPIAEIAKRQDTYSYRGWLVSDSFLKRMAAVYGYNLVGGLAIGCVVFVLVALLALFAVTAGITSSLIF